MKYMLVSRKACKFTSFGKCVVHVLPGAELGGYDYNKPIGVYQNSGYNHVDFVSKVREQGKEPREMVIQIAKPVEILISGDAVFISSDYFDTTHPVPA